jgi:hypothetical protein
MFGRRGGRHLQIGRAKRLPVLAIVGRFGWLHLDYLHALAARVDLTVACGSEWHGEAVAQARREGLRVTRLSPEDSRTALAELISATAPAVIHVLYYRHEPFVAVAAELAPHAVIVYECRDPLTTLHRAPGTAGERLALERNALAASRGQLFVSEALRQYLESLHGRSLAGSSMLVPHGFALRTMGRPARKLSASDGETHIALVGTASGLPGHSHYYVDTIDWLTEIGFVVHSHFFETDDAVRAAYRDLAERNPRYQRHPTVSFRSGKRLSKLISRYDLMGVFYNLDASRHNATDVLSVCMPTRAASGWFHGGIPVVCSPHYRSLVELIDRHEIGFAYHNTDELARLVSDRDAIVAATARTLSIRPRFSHEYAAARIEPFFASLCREGVS